MKRFTFLSISNGIIYLICLLIMFKWSSQVIDIQYNIHDPECKGSFGLCTQEDKDKLGFQAIKKIHEQMDDDKDGQIEIQESRGFMKEELEYKNGAYTERHERFHTEDKEISVDEMWKTWKHSQVHNWTTEDVVKWITVLKLPEYDNNFRRNQIDGQFMPRLALNENNYLLNIMQIKDARHRRLISLKATDLVLFGQQNKPHSLIKDVLMITLLSISIFFCIYLFGKHRKSLEQIKLMTYEFNKLTTNDDMSSYNKSDQSIISSPQSTLTSLKHKIVRNHENLTNNIQEQQKQNQEILENNAVLTKELNLAKVNFEI
jgi:stromal interaction molecule 1